AALVEAKGRARVLLEPEGGPGSAERTGDDEQIPRARAGASRDALRPPDGGDPDDHLGGRARVAADDSNARLHDPLVECDGIRDARRSRGGEDDAERLGKRAGCGEVAQVDRGRAKAELAPGQPVEAEVNGFDEHVLGEDEPGAELRRIVLDADDQAAALDLGQEAELTELRAPHRLPRAWRVPSLHGARR